MKKNSVNYILVNAISISSGGGLLVLKSFLGEIYCDDKQENRYIIFIQDGLEFTNTNNIDFIKVKKKGKFGLLFWHAYGFYSYVKKTIRIENIALVLSLQNFDVYFPEKKRIVYFHQLQILNYQDLFLPIYLKIQYFFYRIIYKITLKTATKIIVQNEWTKKKHLSSFSDYVNKIQVINQYSILKKNDVLQLVNCKSNTAINILDGCEYFFYPSFFHPHKNHKVLFDMMTKLYNEGLLEKNFRLVLTISESLLPKNLPQKLRLFIVCLGELTHEYTINILAKSKGILFPSKAETLGLPLLEAAYLEIPVLVAKEEYAICLLKTYKKVIYCSSDDVSAWSQAVCGVLKNEITFEECLELDQNNGKSLLATLKDELGTR